MVTVYTYLSHVFSNLSTKSLVTGVNPTYWDVVQNFHTVQLNQDNLIWRIKDELLSETNESGRICFYGDDTWMKLFPTNYFTDHDPVTSFFVKDFDEVDNNVTRHLKPEKLNRTNCHFTILHFLGLDHIGHVYGPTQQPELIRSKLNQYDDVIKVIHEYLISTTKSSLILITGDHGMSNLGGHGGNSREEIETAFIALANSPKQSIVFFETKYHEVYQTDIAATLSLLWGLSIPDASIGQIIDYRLLTKFQDFENLLFSYYCNVEKLKTTVSNLPNALSDKYTETVEQHLDFLESKSISEPEKKLLLTNYIDLLYEIAMLTRNSLESEQDIMGMGIAVIFMLQTLLITSVLFVDTSIPRESKTYFNFDNFSSYWTNSKFLAAVGFSTCIMLYFSMHDLILVAINLILLLSLETRITTVLTTRLLLLFKCLVITAIPPTIIYFSSSFIEYEELIRDFVFPSAVIWWTFKKNIGNQLELKIKRNKTSKKNQQETIIQLESLDYLFSLVIILFCHRIVSSWYLSNASDIADEIRSSNITMLNEFLIVISLLITGVFLPGGSTSKKLYFVCGILIGYYKICSKFWDAHPFSSSQDATLLLLSSTLSVQFARLCFCAICCHYVITREFLQSWTLLSFLLLRFYNFGIILLIVVQLHCLNRLFQSHTSHLWMDKTCKFLIYTWFAQSAFFYQGNTNGISSIDVNAGYIGFESYNNPAIIAFLIVWHTFCAPIIVLSYAFKTENASNINANTYTSRKQFVDKLQSVIQLTLIISIEATIYSLVIIALRQHLFIWSVFTPKLLYIFANTVVYSIVVIVVLLCR